MNTEVAPHRAERQVKAIWSIQTDNPFQYSHCIPAFKQSEANTLVQVIATAVTHTVLSKTLKPLEGLSSNMGKRQTLFCRITFNVRFCTPQQRHFSSASVTALQSCHNSCSVASHSSTSTDLPLLKRSTSLRRLSGSSGRSYICAQGTWTTSGL